MNPYDFARIDWDRPPERHKPVWHHQLVKQGTPLYSGSLEVDIYAETPLFIHDPRSAEAHAREAALSMQNALGEYIIPGSSLKGMLRSVVETLSNSCLTLIHGEYKGEREPINYKSCVPDEFQHCTNNAHLCLACRTFGMLGKARFFWARSTSGTRAHILNERIPTSPCTRQCWLNPSRAMRRSTWTRRKNISRGASSTSTIRPT